MTGAIWLVQVLIYPNFKLVSSFDFERLHKFHMSRISIIVGPAMVLEFITAFLLFYLNQNQLFFSNLLSVCALWLITFALNVPTHNKLKFEIEKSKTNLVLCNWPRTILWTARSFALISYAVHLHWAL